MDEGFGVGVWWDWVVGYFGVEIALFFFLFFFVKVEGLIILLVFFTLIYFLKNFDYDDLTLVPFFHFVRVKLKMRS